MSSQAAQRLFEAQRRIPPGAQPVFSPPDRQKKEAAVRYLTGKKPGSYHQSPAGIATPVFRPPPPLPPKPPAAVIDRCVLFYPDPHAANCRPYMNASYMAPARATCGTYNHPNAWGSSYKPARGYRYPPPLGQVVYAWGHYGDPKPKWAEPE